MTQEKIAAAAARIARMEACYDYLQAPPTGCAAVHEACLGQLLDYYTGGQWQQDYLLDEAGLLPAELKRGVLSQDGVDTLLGRLRGQKTHEGGCTP